MTIISIDFSILYPGVCISRNFTDFKWIAVVNAKVGKKENDHFDWINKTYPNVKILRTVSKRKKAELYHVTEKIKLDNYLELINLLIDAIKQEVKDEKDLIVCLEGISFGSKGNSLVDLSQSTGILKHQIVTQLLNNSTERFFIFSPSELKNAIGCKGNANKHDILAKFKSEPIIESVKNSDLFKILHKESWIIEGDKILSPIIDMTDSYLGVVKVHELLK